MKIIKVKDMAQTKKKKENQDEIDVELEKERQKVLEILLKKTGLTYEKLVKHSVGIWVASNIELLTEKEKAQFKYLVF